MGNKPIYHVSLVTGKKYDYETYSNHGYSGIKCGFVHENGGKEWKCFNDLPTDEYPYTLEYAILPKPKWA